MRVPAIVGRSCVAEGNCAAARQGGKQPEANRPSVGERTRFGVNPWRACWIRAKPGMIDDAEATEKAAIGRLAWLGAECREGKAVSAERPVALRRGRRESEPS